MSCRVYVSGFVGRPPPGRGGRCGGVYRKVMISFCKCMNFNRGVIIFHNKKNVHLPPLRIFACKKHTDEDGYKSCGRAGKDGREGHPGHRPGHERAGLRRVERQGPAGVDGGHGGHRSQAVQRCLSEAGAHLRARYRHYRVVPARRDGHRGSFLRKERTEHAEARAGAGRGHRRGDKPRRSHPRICAAEDKNGHHRQRSG